MSWHSDPDTISMSAALGAAQASGAKPGSLEWLIAYRENYKPCDPIEGNAYLQSLENEIEELRKNEHGNNQQF